MNARKRITLGLTSTALVLGAGAGIADRAPSTDTRRPAAQAAGRRARPRSPPTSA